MIGTVFLLGLAALASGQYYQNDPKNVAILTDSRYLSGDGKFGASYTQEDGVQFKEESDPDGTRRGSYSYVDPSGQRKTVSYTAGKNGFQATGDHLPQAPAAPPQPVPTSGYAPNPQYQSPEYRPQYQQPSYQPAPQPYQPPPQSYQPAPQSYQPPAQSYQPRPQQSWTTTPAPHRFYPPGKLSLNRSPDGFSYTFNKS